MGCLAPGWENEMSEKGTNGLMDGQANARKFLAWQAEVEDFRPFVHQGSLSTTRVSRECGLNRDVFYTNPEIRDKLWPALLHRLEVEGTLRQRAVNPVEMIARQPRGSAASDARVKQIQEANEALKAENRELRKQLDRFKGIEDALNTSGRLPW